ncbi:GNAT family N-acetyltransferase [Streptomyces sp. RKAG337]|uniref:GNAT family N-acetyltransferase n=1 Tax=Streptomyces sp. RKAG337 TaxID=2893404 RepID=UPI0020345BEB|nr:GNAT family N-acetyltransferase [Streptomyces sp. RKAG337]MCM2430159.1 GNAT family N-acetyltransferase [Streptomyces sp. RKAG337]
MPQLTPSNPRPSRSHRHHWRRDLVELAALFTAVAAADLVADVVVHGPEGPVLLAASAVALLATAGFHTWWARRHSHAPPGPAPADGAEEPGPATLWRLRTTVRDTPGSLGAVCMALADAGVDILTLQTHPLADGTVDEFLLRAPGSVPALALSQVVGAAGGRDTWTERADAHDLVDTPTRMLTLATRTALDAAELPLALRQLFGRCTIRSVPAAKDGAPAPEESLTETVMTLRDPSGGTITVERAYLPFTPTEFARARALVELDSRLGARMPESKDVLTLPEGNEITIRRAGPEDLPAARAMHDRCSPATLAQRYHGPVPDADRYLKHLLSPRFGRTLAVETASGRLVALAHLLWDGDENEVALLVEDDWQRRGIGAELLRKLVGHAVEAGRGSVYAVTQANNTGMVATMRDLGLPLDYQVEDGTLVITATLTPAGVPSSPKVTSRN